MSPGLAEYLAEARRLEIQWAINQADLVREARQARVESAAKISGPARDRWTGRPLVTEP